MNAYQEGLTPNPCIICNRHIKFGALLDAALDMGIKQGKRADMTKFGAAVHDLKKQGCDMAVLGCTELSLVKRDEHLGAFFIDSTEVLCRHALQACGVEPVGF